MAAAKRSAGWCRRGCGATNVDDDAHVGRRLEVGAAEKPGRAPIRCVGGTEIAAVTASACGRCDRCVGGTEIAAVAESACGRCASAVMQMGFGTKDRRYITANSNEPGVTLRFRYGNGFGRKRTLPDPFFPLSRGSCL
ncbi:hypothetical protein B296_00006896 [Ensete ventricosum]|uniref:Uncharacterized protein n=1 Tax=Ensete ventricosum TaxID=4639 RepID=A0A427AX72_ENSVE|nr:hypothetical protein B296_00006896 [Ensete ventricosum]